MLVPLRELILLRKKSVWLCTSVPERKRWSKWLKEQLEAAGDPSPMWELSSTGDEFETFCAAQTGHLMIAGRFEGMDFPGDTCRLAVFPSLPAATGPLERFTTEQMKDARFQKLRMFERIKQGIGRCTRGANDYAVYYFLDPRFYVEMESRPFAALQSERTQKQVELGLELTQDGMGAVVPFAQQFLSGDFSEFDKREAKATPVAAGTVPAAATPLTVSDEIDGWRALFEARDFARAAQRFELVSGRLADAEREHRAFWKYMEALAEYMRYRLDDEAGALPICQGHLERAIAEGASSSWFNRLRRVKNKLAGAGAGAAPPPDQSAIFERWDELVEKFPHFKGRFLKWQAHVRAGLDGTHKQVCEALQTLGHLLGYAATRPSGDGAADGIWAARDHAITLEAKIEEKREKVSLGDVNQADGQRRAAKAALNLADEAVCAVIVTAMAEADEAALKALGDIRVLPLELIGELQARLERIMRDYWKGWSREDAAKRVLLQREAAARLPPQGWLLRAVRSAKGPFLAEQDLFREVPK